MKPYTDRTALESPRAECTRGLTLFELLVVLAILALLATLIAPRVIGYLGRAKSDIARTQIGNIATALELYFYDVGAYPDAEDGLAALASPPHGVETWRGPYFKDEAGLIDPWGRPYLYIRADNGDAFVVTTLGRDGAEGGEGEDTDLSKS